MPRAGADSLAMNQWSAAASASWVATELELSESVAVRVAALVLEGRVCVGVAASPGLGLAAPRRQLRLASPCSGAPTSAASPCTSTRR